MSKKRFDHTCSVAKLAREFANCNGVDGTKAYIAGMLHDIAKEMDRDEEMHLMKEYYPQFVLKPRPIYHQWLSTYLAKKDFYIEEKLFCRQLPIIQRLRWKCLNLICVFIVRIN